MHRRARLILAIGTLALSACSESATMPDFSPQSAHGPNPNTSVTATIFDRDDLGNLLLTRSDNPGAGQASYSASSSGVTSVILSGDGWQLVLGNQQVRTLFLVLASQGMPAPDGYYYQNVEAYSRCFAANNATPLSFLQMADAQSYTNCSFGVDFKYGNTKYKFAMSPQHAGTGRAVVTCTGSLNGSCQNWSVKPNTGTSSTANLYEFAKNGSLIFKGAYQNTYSVTIAR